MEVATAVTKVDSAAAAEAVNPVGCRSRVCMMSDIIAHRSPVIAIAPHTSHLRPLYSFLYMPHIDAWYQNCPEEKLLLQGCTLVYLFTADVSRLFITS